jgi:hypothetical protein
MMELILSLPSWVIAAIVGAIAGGIGAVIAQTFFKRWPMVARYFPLVLVAATFGLTDNVILPALQNSDWAMCATAERAARTTTESQAGTKLDEVTTFTQMQADCGQKAVHYLITVAAGRDQLTDEGIAGVRADFNAGQCGDANWRKFIDRGWTIANDYSFTSGEPMTITAECT